ncbi:hypothetical protein Tco_0960019 [Tanacetum coccineum]
MPGGKRPQLPTPTPTPSTSFESTSSSSHQGEENDPVNNFTLDHIPYINQLPPIEGGESQEFKQTKEIFKCFGHFLSNLGKKKEPVPSSCNGRSHCGDGTAKNRATVLAGSVPLHWPVLLRRSSTDFGLQVKEKSDGIFISQDKYVADILKKFDFATVKTAGTPIETNKALLKDEEAKDVDVHLYRSMIGSLMYLIASRLDIMFAICACARFQVTPKVSHLHAVKRIFRYLKGQPKLGLWYPRDSPFDLEAFSDSDYAGASLDRKSTTGAEYVAAANCYGQVLWVQNQMLDYGFNFLNTKIYIDNESTICIVKNTVFHFKTKHIEIRDHFIRDSYEKKLIQVIKIHTDHDVADLLTKAFDVSRFNFLIASIGLLIL